MTGPNGATAPGALATPTPVTGAQPAPTQPSEQQVEASLVQDLERLFGEPEAASAAAESTDDLSNQAGGAEAHEAPAQTDSGPDTDTPEATETDGETEAPAEPEAADEETDEPKTVPYRRLAKEIAKRKALEERLEALEAKAEAKAPDAPKPEAGPEDPELKPHREKAAKAEAELQAARDLKALLKTDPEAVAAQIRKVAPRVGTDEESLREWLNDYADTQRDKLAEAKATLAATEQAVTQKRQQQAAQARAEAQQQVDAVAPWVKASVQVATQLREAEADGDTATVAALRRKLDPRWNLFAQYMGTPEIQRHPLGLKVAAALAEFDHRRTLANKPAAAKPAPNTVRPGAPAAKAAPRQTGQPADRRTVALKQFEQEPSEKALLAALDY